jgi:hypothetical protein
MYRIIRQPDPALGYSYMPQMYKRGPFNVFSRWANMTTCPYAKQDDAEEFVERFALAQAGTTVVKQYGIEGPSLPKPWD